MISSFYELVVWSGLFTKVSVYDRVVGDQVACLAGVERGRGVGRKGKRGGLGREGKAPFPFPLFRAFIPPPPPPLFAPATQARDQVVSREGSRENTLVGIIILYDYSI